jgi:hypothetical protein
MNGDVSPELINTGNVEAGSVKTELNHAVQALWQCYHGFRFGISGSLPGIENAAYVAPAEAPAETKAEPAGFMIAT